MPNYCGDLTCEHFDEDCHDEAKLQSSCYVFKITLSEIKQNEMQDARKAVLQKSVFIGEDEK